MTLSWTILLPAVAAMPLIALSVSELRGCGENGWLADVGGLRIFTALLWYIWRKCLPLQPGKSYTTSSPGTPPGLDRSNGTGS